MIFERSILREKITVMTVILLTLLTITSVIFLIKGLQLAAEGSTALDAVLQYVLIATLKFLPLIIVVTVMIAIIMTVSRLYRDSEMAVWQSSGVGSLSLLKPIAMLVLPMFFFVLFLNAVLTPWTTKSLAVYKNQSNIQALNLAKNGAFRTAEAGSLVFFVDESLKEKNKPLAFNKVFVVKKTAQNQTTLLVAQSAEVERGFDDRAFFVLKDGWQYDDKKNEGIFQSMSYNRYGFSLDEFTQIKTSDLTETPVDQRTTRELWKDNARDSNGELFRRLSNAFMLLPMALLALVLGYVKPRGARTWSLLIGLLTFVLYAIWIRSAENYISSGRWSLMQAVLSIHVFCFMLVILALWYRQFSWRVVGLSSFFRRGV